MPYLQAGRILFLLLSLSLCSTLQAQVLVLNNPTAPPLTTDSQDGLLDVVVSEAFRRCGLELKLIKLPAERALRNANEGIDDGDMSRIAGLEKVYPNLIRVPEKIFDMEFVAFSKQKDMVITDWNSLEPYNVGLIKGWKIFENGTRHLPNVVAVRDADVMFSMLDKNRIEVALYARWLGLYHIKTMNLQGIHDVKPPLATKEMFIYLHKKHHELVPKIAQALREVKQSGMYERNFKEKFRAIQP